MNVPKNNYSNNNAKSLHGVCFSIFIIMGCTMFYAAKLGVYISDIALDMRIYSILATFMIYFILIQYKHNAQRMIKEIYPISPLILTKNFPMVVSNLKIMMN